jgi:hypothetical protein
MAGKKKLIIPIEESNVQNSRILLEGFKEFCPLIWALEEIGV